MRRKVWWPIAAVAVGLYLLTRPQCVRGCRTVAQYLLTRGIYGLFG
jgi:hypothetical protein